jgi:hypothetical protein
MMDEDITRLTKVDSELEDSISEVGKYGAHQIMTYTCLLTIASCGYHSLAVEGTNGHRPFHSFEVLGHVLNHSISAHTTSIEV